MKTNYTSNRALRFRHLEVVLEPEEVKKILGGQNIEKYVRPINKKLIIHPMPDHPNYRGSDISDKTLDVYVGGAQFRYLGPTTGICTCPFQMSDYKWDFMIELCCSRELEPNFC